MFQLFCLLKKLLLQEEDKDFFKFISDKNKNKPKIYIDV